MNIYKYVALVFQMLVVLTIVFAAISCDTCHKETGRSTVEKPHTASSTQTGKKQKPVDKTAKTEEVKKVTLPRPADISLFDGKTLGHWEITDFWDPGKVRIADGLIHLEAGNDLTGITWKGPLPRMNYEVSLDAKRVDGEDFFCGLTFPVEDNSCTLIVGGWGGQVVGLSNIDYYDAVNNETTQVMSFETGQWYHIRVRVTKTKIEAWIDGEQMVDIVTTGRKIDVRMEIEASMPLGVASWRTGTALRNIRLKTN